MMDIYEAIKAQLAATGAVTDIIGTGDDMRGYPVKAPQGTAPEYLAWKTVSAPSDHTMSSDSGNPVYQLIAFSSFAETLAEALALANAVDAMFSAFNSGGTLGGGGGLAVDGIAVEEKPIEDWDAEAGADGLWRADQDISFYYLRG